MNANIWLITVIIALVITGVITVFISTPIIKKRVQRQTIVSTDEMKMSENRLQDFIRLHQLSTPLNLNEVAKILKVEDGGIDSKLIDKSEQAYISNRDEKGFATVYFQEGLSLAEKLFAFAHELAHIINADPIPSSRIEGHEKPQSEQLADYMAAAMLMPIHEVYKYIIDKDIELDNNVSLTGAIQHISETYKVEASAAKNRIKEIFALIEVGYFKQAS